MEIRKIMHLILSASLYITSAVPFAYGQQQQQAQQPSSSGGFSQIASGLSGAMDLAAQTMLNARSQQNQMNMMMISYQKSNVTPPFYPAEYFPMCQTTPTKMDTPEHACANITRSAELQQAELG